LQDACQNETNLLPRVRPLCFGETPSPVAFSDGHQKTFFRCRKKFLWTLAKSPLPTPLAHGQIVPPPPALFRDDLSAPQLAAEHFGESSRWGKTSLPSSMP
jgi:hypothetical protein